MLSPSFLLECFHVIVLPVNQLRGFVYLHSSYSLPPPLISALFNFFLCFLLLVSLGLP